MTDDQTPNPGTGDPTDPAPGEPDPDGIRVVRRRNEGGGDGDGGGNDGTPDGDGTDGDDPDRAAALRSRQRRVSLITALVVVIALIVGLVVWQASEDETVASPPSTSSTTATLKPTTTAAPVDEIFIATAKVPELTILSTAPPEWNTAPVVSFWTRPDPPSSNGTLPPRPPLPRPDYPIAGRYSTDTGWAFSNPTSFDGPLKLLVREQRGSWLRVEVPVRPNGTEGWVAVSDVDLSTSTQRVELSVGQRMLRVFDSTQLISETPVVVGKDETRTPLGRFFITDRVPQEDPAGFYGPLVLPLSAYSEQLDKFDEGVPVIAIHGTSRPDLLGTAASNGCVRMSNDVITLLGQTLPLGTPVDVIA